MRFMSCRTATRCVSVVGLSHPYSKAFLHHPICSPEEMPFPTIDGVSEERLAELQAHFDNLTSMGLPEEQAAKSVKAMGERPNQPTPSKTPTKTPTGSPTSPSTVGCANQGDQL